MKYEVAFDREKDRTLTSVLEQLKGDLTSKGFKEVACDAFYKHYDDEYEWLKENINGRFDTDYVNKFTFKSETDAVAFKLRWA